MNVSELAPKAGEAEGFLKALANRHRLMILCQLHDGELSVTALQQALGLSQSSLSQHLARLRADQVVKTRRSSQSIYYSISNPAVSGVMAVLYDRFCSDQRASAKKRPPVKARRGPAKAIAK
ncbi:MAG: metalloregulator ArsR/SmtB family transcription factor [Methylocystis sp.]|jgi:DNA-binding transcriptional ArsR family regulator